MWDLPGPGLDPVSPALAGGFLTIAPPGKSSATFLKYVIYLNGNATKLERGLDDFRGGSQDEFLWLSDCIGLGKMFVWVFP